MKKILVFAVLVVGLVGLGIFQNCSNPYESDIYNSTKSDLRVREALSVSLVTVGDRGSISSNHQGAGVAQGQQTSPWYHYDLDGAYLGVNPWAFWSSFSTSVPNKEISWKHEHTQDGEDLLTLKWFVGGNYRDFGGLPEADHALGGGNNVRAYPRIGLGSSSGQPIATSFVNGSLPVTHTAGTKTVNQELVGQTVGLPSVVRDMPNIYIHAHMRFRGGEPRLPERDRYGNYFLAIDSYYHDTSKVNDVANPALVNSLNGINDTSGTIFETQLPLRRNGKKYSTKKWAIMVWYAKSPYYQSSGGSELNGGRAVNIGGISYLVKYKIEHASDLDFYYVSFTMNKDATQLTNNGNWQNLPVINYKDIADFVTDSSKLQELLDRYEREVGPLAKIGDDQRVMAPTKDYILSHIDFGPEISTNPDMPNDRRINFVYLDFKNLYFQVNGGRNNLNKKVGFHEHHSHEPTSIGQALPGPQTQTTSNSSTSSGLPTCSARNGQGNPGNDGSFYEDNGQKCQPTANTLTSNSGEQSSTSNTQLPICTSRGGQGNPGNDGSFYNDNGQKCQPNVGSVAESTNTQSNTSSGQLPACTSNNNQGYRGDDGNYYDADGTKCFSLVTGAATSESSSNQSSGGTGLLACTSRGGQGNPGNDGNFYNDNGQKCQPSGGSAANSPSPPAGNSSGQLPACTSNGNQGYRGEDGNHYDADGTKCFSIVTGAATPGGSTNQPSSGSGLPACTSRGGQGNPGNDGNFYNNDGQKCQPSSGSAANSPSPRAGNSSGQFPVCSSNNGAGNKGGDNNYYNNNGQRCQPAR